MCLTSFFHFLIFKTLSYFYLIFLAVLEFELRVLTRQPL
jgi:hypothetical protein